MDRLLRVEAKGLLGRFHHVIFFPQDWEFLILHGPNGIGKTKLLELISFALSGNIFRLTRIPFGAVEFEFTGGTQLRVTLESGGDAAESQGHTKVKYEMRRANRIVVAWTGDDRLTDELRRRVNIETPLYRNAPDEWFDPQSNETMSTLDAAERYGLLRRGRAFQDMPARLAEFIEQHTVHLVETQRLLLFPADTPSRRHPGRFRPTVAEFALDLTRRLRDALTENSTVSQQLDRSFPRRILAASGDSATTDSEIRERYQRQSELRARLAEIAVIDTGEDLPLPSRVLTNWERRVLWTYLEDTEQKLSTFANLLERVRLLREMINSRFLYKELVIDREVGFRFVAEDGAQVPLESLSSGEQHELVLAYDLLFNVERGTLVLIDEPEISLHVAWQQQFLPDIVRIADLASLRFIIATHSPQIIHSFWDRASVLRPEE